MKNINLQNILLAFALVLAAAVTGSKAPAQVKVTPTPPGNSTAPVKVSPTASRTRTPTPLVSPTASSSATVTATDLPSLTATATASKTNTPGGAAIQPFRSAPACVHSSNNTYHGLWDYARGCHYDHEHGQNPFTLAVAAAFAPLGDLQELLGGVQIGHSNPSSPAENVAKHGGFKWQVNLVPVNINEVFEGGTIAVKRYAIQYHVFGRQDIEHEARNHSSAAMFEFYKIGGDVNDVGYMFVIQLQEYGQRVTPYQGYILPYPDNFQPTWASPRGPYLTNECVGADIPMPAGMSDLGITSADCRDSRAGHIAQNGNVNSVWTSKPTGVGSNDPARRPPTSKLFRLLFRIRDGYQMLDSRDLVHPFTWVWMCSSDGGATYNGQMPGCRWNSSTSTINEVMGDIPASWDGASFDRDPRPGRVTADLFVTRYGDLNPSCLAAGGNCYPLKLVSMFVGRYSSELQAEKVSNPEPHNVPERDVYFCGAAVCSETSPGAVPSGWIGSEN